jgi:hypothetical protein
MSAIKKYIIPFILYVILFYFIGNFGYWWINLPVAFIISYLFIPRALMAFILHLLIIFISWVLLSMIKDSEVSGEVSRFLSLLAGNIPPFLTYLIAGLTGGLMTGWAGFLGSYLKSITKSDL